MPFSIKGSKCYSNGTKIYSSNRSLNELTIYIKIANGLYYLKSIEKIIGQANSNRPCGLGKINRFEN